MLGKTAINKVFVNQSCVERIVNGEKVYTPIAQLYAAVSGNDKIPSNIQVTPIDQSLYIANKEIVEQDYNEFYQNMLKEVNKED